MPSTLAPDVDLLLRHAAERATLAPSIHNTQPWRFVARPGHLDLFADPVRSLAAIDPAGRQLAISCGAALFGARVALAASGMEVVTELLPDLKNPGWLATLTIIGPSSDSAEQATRLDRAADGRHSNRREFTSAQVPDSDIELLCAAAAVEGARLQQVTTEDDRVAVAVHSQHADALQHADPAYRAELRAWTTTDPTRPDGVPASAVPLVTGESHDDIPIRDFDGQSAGQLPVETRSSLNQTLLVLVTDRDNLQDWLLAGQALGRVLLELTSLGYVASIFSQFAEVPGTRRSLQHDLRVGGEPHVILRVGRAEATPSTPRRPFDQVITAS